MEENKVRAKIISISKVTPHISERIENEVEHDIYLSLPPKKSYSVRVNIGENQEKITPKEIGDMEYKVIKYLLEENEEFINIPKLRKYIDTDLRTLMNVLDGLEKKGVIECED